MFKTVMMATATLGLAAIGLGAPGLAQEEKDKKVERVIILEHGEAGERRHKEEHIMRIRRGDGARHIMLSDCKGEKIEVAEGDDKEKTQIVLCGDTTLTAEERAKKLEELRTKLASNDRLSVEHRARVEAALKRAIERVRAGD